jgi:hypothetical protein
MVLGAVFIPRVQFGTAELVVQVLVGEALSLQWLMAERGPIFKVAGWRKHISVHTKSMNLRSARTSATQRRTVGDTPFISSKYACSFLHHQKAQAFSKFFQHPLCVAG